LEVRRQTISLTATSPWPSPRSPVPLLRENGRGNVATDRRFRSPHRRGLRRGRYLSFGRVTGHHAGYSTPRPSRSIRSNTTGGLGHHKETLLDESLEGDGKQTSPRRENGGTRVKSANRWLFPLLTSQNKEHQSWQQPTRQRTPPTDEGKAERRPLARSAQRQAARRG